MTKLFFGRRTAITRSGSIRRLSTGLAPCAGRESYSVVILRRNRSVGGGPKDRNATIPAADAESLILLVMTAATYPGPAGQSAKEVAFQPPTSAITLIFPPRTPTICIGVWG
jgi:hypothetical protein